MRKRLANLLLKLAILLGARVQLPAIGSYGEHAASAILMQSPTWSVRNAADFVAFLKTDTGACFIQRLRCIAAQNAIKGSFEKRYTIHAAGVSAGWNECADWVHSLSRVSGVQDTKPNDGQTPQDEASLLELYSP